jgi:hypothetical protein
MPRREPDTAEDVRAREPSAVLRPPRPRRVPNNDARRLGATRRARPSASNCARARDGDGTGRGSEDAGGLGAFPLGPGWAPCGRSRMPRRWLRDTASARSWLMPPRRSGSWTLRDRDEHEASGGHETERCKETTAPRAARTGGVRGRLAARARDAWKTAGWATGGAAVDGVRATARRAGSIRGRLGGDTTSIIFARLRASVRARVPCGRCSPWRHRRHSARVVRPPSDARGVCWAGQAGRPFLRSEACSLWCDSFRRVVS